MDRRYTENDIEAFAHGPEGHYFDRKSARKDADEIAKHVMAFANAAGGKLVVGIEDDGTVTGFKREKAHSIEGFERAHVTELKPSPKVEAERVGVVNVKGEDDQVLVLEVDYSDDQVIRRRKDGMVALRDGDKSLALDYEQIRALEYDKGVVRYESVVCRDSGLDDIDHEAVEMYKAALGADVDDERLLRSRHFLKGDHLTNAGVLLFAAEPSFILPQARIRVVKIDGTELGTGARMNVVKDETFDGPLVKAYPQAKAFIASQLRDFQFERPGATFATISEYPEFPWAEGLANAVAHRDYSIEGEYTRVYIFDDRMEITSPGKTPNFVTIENMRDSRYSRNPRLARALTAFAWVREFNEGVKKIYEDMADAGLPDPEFSAPNRQSVKLTLRNDVENRIPRFGKTISSCISSSVDEIHDEIKLDPDHALILSVMKENPTATYPLMASITGFSESKVYRIATALRKKGVVDRVGSRKSGVWKIAHDK